MYATPSPDSVKLGLKSNRISLRYPVGGNTMSGKVIVLKGSVALFSMSNPTIFGPPGTLSRLSPPLVAGLPVSSAHNLPLASTIAACTLIQCLESLEPKAVPELVLTRPSGGVLNSKLGKGASAVALTSSTSVNGFVDKSPLGYYKRYGRNQVF